MWCTIILLSLFLLGENVCAGKATGDEPQLDAQIYASWPHHAGAPVMEASEFFDAFEENGGFWRFVDEIESLGDLDLSEGAEADAVNVASKLLKNDVDYILTEKLLRTSLGMREFSPAIEQQRQLGIALWKQFHGDDAMPHDAWIAFKSSHGVAFIDKMENIEDRINEIFSLNSKVTFYEFQNQDNAYSLFGQLGSDHIAPNSCVGNTCPVVAVLHGVLGSPSFMKMLKVLRKHLNTRNDTTVIVRYCFPEQHSLVDGQVALRGYGVTIDIKNMEYVTVDDDIERSTAKEEKSQVEPGTETLDQTLAPLSPEELRLISLRTTARILESSKPISYWADAVSNFPSRVKYLKDVKISAKMEAEAQRQQLVYGMNRQNEVGSIHVNGIPFDANSESFNAFSLLETVRNELKTAADTADLVLPEGIDRYEIIEKLTRAFSEGFEDNDEEDRETKSLRQATLLHGLRFDLREGARGAVLFLNNIEKDKRYSSWPSDLRYLLQPSFRLLKVRKNFYTVIVVVDPGTEEGKKALQNVFQAYADFDIARFGLVFLGNSNASSNKICDRNCFLELFHAAREEASKGVAIQVIKSLSFSSGVLSKDEATTIFAEVVHNSKSRDSNTDLAQLKRKALDRLNSERSNAGQKTAGAMDEYLHSKGFDQPLWSLNGIVKFDINEMRSQLSGLIMGEQQLLQYFVYLNHVDQRTDIFKFLLDFSLALPRSHPVFALKTKDSTFVPMMLKDEPDWLSTIPYFFSGLGNSESESLESAVTLWFLLDDVDFRSQSASSIVKKRLKEIFRYASTKPHGVRIALLPWSDTAKWIHIKQLIQFWKHITQEKPLDFDVIQELIEKLDFEGDSEIESDRILTGLGSTVRRFREQRTKGFSGGHGALICNGRVIEINDNFRLEMGDLELLVYIERYFRADAAVKVLGSVPTMKSGGHDFADLILSLSSCSASRSSVDRMHIDVGEWENEFPSLVLRSHVSENSEDARKPHPIRVRGVLNPLSKTAPQVTAVLQLLQDSVDADITILLFPTQLTEYPISSYFRFATPSDDSTIFSGLPKGQLLNMKVSTPEPWIIYLADSDGVDTDNILLSDSSRHYTIRYRLNSLLVTGHCQEAEGPPAGLQLQLEDLTSGQIKSDTLVMRNLGYWQLQASPGMWRLAINEGRSRDLYSIVTSISVRGRSADLWIKDGHPGKGKTDQTLDTGKILSIRDFYGHVEKLKLKKNPGKETEKLLEPMDDTTSSKSDSHSHTNSKSKSVMEKLHKGLSSFFSTKDKAEEIESEESKSSGREQKVNETIHVFSIASGALYERFLRIMMVSVKKHTSGPVKFWLIDNFLSPEFRASIEELANHYGFQYSMVTYKWPYWLHRQTEKQRIIWGYKILFLDVLFPLDIPKIIYVDADQVVRADLRELWEMDLHGKPYAYTPFCDSRKETLGFQFWRSGFWKDHLRGSPYHISALYVVDLNKFRVMMVGDQLRGTYEMLSKDPASLSNLDQDLPNYVQSAVPIHSLPQEWLWCESWCSDETKASAKTIDLCNNPLHKEPKLQMAKRIISGTLFKQSWIELDSEIKEVMAPEKVCEEPEECQSETVSEKEEL